MFGFHKRLLGGVVAGFAGWAAATAMGAPFAARVLIGWNVGALIYLAAVWAVFIRAGDAEIREEPPGRMRRAA